MTSAHFQFQPVTKITKNVASRTFHESKILWDTHCNTALEFHPLKLNLCYRILSKFVIKISVTALLLLDLSFI